MNAPEGQEPPAPEPTGSESTAVEPPRPSDDTDEPPDDWGPGPLGQQMVFKSLHPKDMRTMVPDDDPEVD